MTKALFALAVAATLAAGDARGQIAPTPEPAQKSAPAQGKTVEGVTVLGRRPQLKACSSRDDACIAAVVAELKAHYPKELQAWCSQVRMRAAQNTMDFMEINLDRPHPNVQPYTPPPVTKTACAAGKKP